MLMWWNGVQEGAKENRGEQHSVPPQLAPLQEMSGELHLRAPHVFRRWWNHAVRVLLLGLLLFGSAHAQTYTNIYSPWMPWDARIKYTGTVSLLDASGVEVNKAPLNSLFNNVTVAFPVQITSATVTKVRVSLFAAGTTNGVADMDSTMIVNYALSPVYVIPAGAIPTLVYNPMSFSPTLVASAPMPVVVPPPPPPVGVSPNGTKIPPAISLTDASGAVWTVGAKTLAGYIPFLRNGKQVGLGGVLCISGGNVWSVDGWQMWTSTTGWTGVQATAPAGC